MQGFRLAYAKTGFTFALKDNWNRQTAALDNNVENVARNKLMARMNDLLNRRSYIRNLVRNVAAELTG